MKEKSFNEERVRKARSRGAPAATGGTCGGDRSPCASPPPPYLPSSLSPSRAQAAEKIRAAKGKASQGRMEAFFGASTLVPSAKRQAEAAAGAGGSKGGKEAPKKAKKGVGYGKK